MIGSRSRLSNFNRGLFGSRVVLVLVFLVCFPTGAAAAEKDVSGLDRPGLEKKVQQLLAEDSIVRWKNLGDIFLLADLYALEGDDKKAEAFYEEGLRVDSWRLEYQLALARLLYKRGDVVQAAEKAGLVRQYAGNAALAEEAGEMLAAIGPQAVLAPPQPAPSLNKEVEIVLVPIGRVDEKLLELGQETIQRQMGIACSIASKRMSPGVWDSSQAGFLLDQLAKFFEANVPDKMLRGVLQEEGLTGEDLRSEQGMLRFIERSTSSSVLPPGQLLEFHQTLSQLKDRGRYNAERLVRILYERYPPWEGKPAIRGYLGVTEEAILVPEVPDLPAASYVSPPYGVFSYHLFLAATFLMPSPRERLREWFSKEVLSCALHILGIPPCTTPVCPGASSIELIRVNQKSSGLCPRCREALRAYLAKPGSGMSLDEVSSQLLKVHALSEENRLQEALSLYQELLQIYPEDARVVASFLWFCGSHAWWPFGKDEGALAQEGMRLGEQALKRWPGKPEIMDALGWLAYKSGNPQRAIPLLKEVIACQKTCSRLYLLSMASGAAGQWDQAVRSYREALALQPEGREADYKGYREVAEALINGAQN